MCDNVLQPYLLKVKGFSSEDAGACDYLDSIFMNIAIKTKLLFFFFSFHMSNQPSLIIYNKTSAYTCL